MKNNMKKKVQSCGIIRRREAEEYQATSTVPVSRNQPTTAALAGGEL